MSGYWYYSIKLPYVTFQSLLCTRVQHIKLLEEIEARGHSTTGTVRATRTEKCLLTPVKNFEKSERGSIEHLSCYDHRVAIARWNDNGIITIASNHHSVLPMGQAKRFSMPQMKTNSVPMPKLVREHNVHMGGVDRLDQNVFVQG